MDIHEIANTIIRGEKCLVFPLRYEGGYIVDTEGQMILQMRGWGYLQYAEDDKGADLQDEIADWVVKTLNEKFLEAK